MLGENLSGPSGVLYTCKDCQRKMAESDRTASEGTRRRMIAAAGEDGAEMAGYVWDVKPRGVETCNCHAKAVDDRDRLTIRVPLQISCIACY